MGKTNARVEQRKKKAPFILKRGFDIKAEINV